MSKKNLGYGLIVGFLGIVMLASGMFLTMDRSAEDAAGKQPPVPTAVEVSEKRTLTVSGNGVANAVPDVLYINFGVFTQDEKLSKAMTLNKESSKSALQSLKEHAIADNDICTVNFQVGPRYKYEQNGDSKLMGYSVSNEFVVTVRNLDKASVLLDALTSNDDYKVSGIHFDVLNKNKVSDQAREDAVMDAIRKGKLFAEIGGGRLGKVLSIVEHESYSPVYSPRMMADSRAEKGVPIAKGERQFKSSVSVMFVLEDAVNGKNLWEKVPVQELNKIEKELSEEQKIPLTTPKQDGLESSIVQHEFVIDFVDNVQSKDIPDALSPFKVKVDLLEQVSKKRNVFLVVIESDVLTNDILGMLGKKPLVEKISHNGIYKKQ